jgi:probable phosphomutase (TIGR03848 family)
LTELLLIRHAVNDFVKTGRLAGWTPAVHLNALGKAQAAALGERLAKTHIDAIYSSPLERTLETAQAVAEHHPHLAVQALAEIGEVRYGDWQGGELSKLSGRKMWRTVQLYPTRARFPNGEAMRDSQLRAVNAIEQLVEAHPRQRLAVVSHSDIIKMILAHYLGVHLDLFQRLEISPASLSVLHLGVGRPTIALMNETHYLPERAPVVADARTQTEIGKLAAITIGTVGRPGERIFYLQAWAESEAEPFCFLLEKTQALMLADHIGERLANAPAGPAATPPQFRPPEQVVFRIGQFALEYEPTHPSEGAILTLTEMLGEGQGQPRQFRLTGGLGQWRALASTAQQVFTAPKA